MEGDCRSSRQSADTEIDVLVCPGDDHEVCDPQRPCDLDKVLQDIALANLGRKITPCRQLFLLYKQERYTTNIVSSVLTVHLNNPLVTIFPAQISG